MITKEYIQIATETYADNVVVILYSAMLNKQVWVLVPIRQYWFEMKEQVLACPTISLFQSLNKKYRF